MKTVPEKYARKSFQKQLYKKVTEKITIKNFSKQSIK